MSNVCPFCNKKEIKTTRVCCDALRTLREKLLEGI